MVLRLDVLSSSGTRILLEYLAAYVQRAGITMIAPGMRRVNQKKVIPDNNNHDSDHHDSLFSQEIDNR